MGAVTTEGKLGGIDRLDRRHRIALDTRYLHQASHRIASETEIVLKPNLGGVLDLCRGSAKDSGETSSGHRTGRTDLTLTADLGTRDGRIFLA